jgi:hypothetical protein
MRNHIGKMRAKTNSPTGNKFNQTRSSFSEDQTRGRAMDNYFLIMLSFIHVGYWRGVGIRKDVPSL